MLKGLVRIYLSSILILMFSSILVAEEKVKAIESFKLNGLTGYKDSITGEIIIRPEYEALIFFSEGLVGFCKNGKWGFMDAHEKVVIEAKYSSVQPFSDGLALIEVDGKRGYINKNDDFVIQPQDLLIFLFNVSEGMIPFHMKTSGEKQPDIAGYLDRKGKVAINPSFSFAAPFYEGLAVVETSNGLYGCIDHSGNFVIPPCDYAFIGLFFRGGRLAVMKNDKCGYMDKTGKIVIEPKYNMAHSFCPDSLCAMVELDGKAFVIDYNGKILFNANDLDEDSLFKIKCQDGKWGFINSAAFLISGKYDDAHEFSEKKAAIKMGDKWGFIGLYGEILISPVYDDVIEDFKNGRALVLLNGKRIYIDEKDIKQ